MLEVLRGLPPEETEPTLKGVEVALEELLALEEGYAAAVRPESSSRDLATALERVLEQIDSASGSGPVRKARSSLYEDVFAVASGGNSVEGEVVRLLAQTAREILADAEFISRFAFLFNHRHDVLHTLAAVWAEGWRSRRKMGVLELFQEFKGMWNQYLRFDLSERYNNFSSFDPLGLPKMEKLRQIRRLVREGTLALLRSGLTACTCHLSRSGAFWIRSRSATTPSSVAPHSSSPPTQKADGAQSAVRGVWALPEPLSSGHGGADAESVRPPISLSVRRWR